MTFCLAVPGNMGGFLDFACIDAENNGKITAGQEQGTVLRGK